MPLSGNLRTVDLTIECPRCNHALVKSGGWFQTIPHFTCEGCQSKIRLTYADKVALFEKHTHLA